MGQESTRPALKESKGKRDTQEALLLKLNPYHLKIFIFYSFYFESLFQFDWQRYLLQLQPSLPGPHIGIIRLILLNSRRSGNLLTFMEFNSKEEVPYILIFLINSCLIIFSSHPNSLRRISEPLV